MENKNKRRKSAKSWSRIKSLELLTDHFSEGFNQDVDQAVQTQLGLELVGHYWRGLCSLRTVVYLMQAVDNVLRPVKKWNARLINRQVCPQKRFILRVLTFCCGSSWNRSRFQAGLQQAISKVRPFLGIQHTLSCLWRICAWVFLLGGFSQNK